ncbi:AAA family ATPase (plasmid) [Phormidium sp. CLA17]|uniref:AAA family ATPase n=1 Tax=Leptolyngbya sp. Cla-17 TaxID=2803751 RepID=UPI0014926C5A|nr:AAA family ATPase [Leptolyngbya sp. Cla-17]MBM0745522.1 AAA family ATPase [Leptolyngbya sp. Cla-17]
MIVVCGGIKGGGGKTTLATNLAVMRALAGYDVLLVDADEQDSASDFTVLRNQIFEPNGGAGYTAIKLRGQAVRSEVARMASKYDDVVIDAGGRDNTGHRAALLVANLYLVPLFPGSFDAWTLDSVAKLIDEASAFNDQLKSICFINRADAQGGDNEEAAQVARETEGLIFLEQPIGTRKAFRRSASEGKAVVEYRPKDTKAIDEITRLYRSVFNEKWSLAQENK